MNIGEFRASATGVWEEASITQVVMLLRGCKALQFIPYTTWLHARYHQYGYFNKVSLSNRILIILFNAMRNNHESLLNHGGVYWLPHAKSHIFLLQKS